MGYMGMNSLGHTVFFGCSAYVAGSLSVKFGFGPIPAAIVGVLFSVVLGAIIGMCTSRMRGVIYMMVTVAFAQIFWGMANQWVPITGGDSGLTGVPRPQFFGIDFRVPNNLYYLMLIIFVICIWLLNHIAGLPFGLAIRGVKETESRMSVLGYSVRMLKTLAMVVAGFFAGIAGVMWLWFNGFVGTGELAITTSAKAIVMVLIGGVGTIIGPLIGAFTLVFAESYISSYTERWMMIMGFLYIVVVMFMKGGLIGLAKKVYVACETLIAKKRSRIPGD